MITRFLINFTHVSFFFFSHAENFSDLERGRWSPGRVYRMEETGVDLNVGT